MPHNPLCLRNDPLCVSGKLNFTYTLTHPVLHVHSNVTMSNDDIHSQGKCIMCLAGSTLLWSAELPRWQELCSVLLTHIIIKMCCCLSVHTCITMCCMCALFTIAATVSTLHAASAGFTACNVLTAVCIDVQRQCKLCRHCDITIVEKKINFKQSIGLVDF